MEDSKARPEIISTFLKEIGANEEEVKTWTTDLLKEVLNETNLINLNKTRIEIYFKKLKGRILLFPFFYLFKFSNFILQKKLKK